MENNVEKARELKAFDDTKIGVKGLVDSGITNIPTIFRHPPENFTSSNETQVNIPIIDLESIGKDPIQRKEIVRKVCDASKTWGFFQVVNHGIPEGVLDEMLTGVRRFYEQDSEVRKEFYTRDSERAVRYNSTFNLFSTQKADWRDTMFCVMAPNPPKPEDLPAACRDILVEFSKQVMKLGILLFELLSEALGLNPNHLKNMDCAEGLAVLCHYYPTCPEPELTLGTRKHTDSGFLTVLLQDHIGGLQVLHNNNWINVKHIQGALIINIADMLQLISNDKFKSVEHRVLANREGPRVSVACFFRTDLQSSLGSRTYGPIKELLTEDNPPKYRETTVKEYVSHFANSSVYDTSTLLDFKL